MATAAPATTSPKWHPPMLHGVMPLTPLCCIPPLNKAMSLAFEPAHLTCHLASPRIGSLVTCSGPLPLYLSCDALQPHTARPASTTLLGHTHLLLKRSIRPGLTRCCIHHSSRRCGRHQEDRPPGREEPPGQDPGERGCPGQGASYKSATLLPVHQPTTGRSLTTPAALHVFQPEHSALLPFNPSPSSKPPPLPAPCIRQATAVKDALSASWAKFTAANPTSGITFWWVEQAFA